MRPINAACMLTTLLATACLDTTTGEGAASMTDSTPPHVAFEPTAPGEPEDPRVEEVARQLAECSTDAIGLECSRAAAEAVLALRSALYAAAGPLSVALGADAVGIPAAVVVACGPQFEADCLVHHIGVEGLCALASTLSHGTPALAPVVTACTGFKVGEAIGGCVGEALACALYPPDLYDQPIDPNNCVASDGTRLRPGVMACSGGQARSIADIMSDCTTVVNGYAVSDPNTRANCMNSCVTTTSAAVNANCPRDAGAGPAGGVAPVPLGD